MGFGNCVVVRNTAANMAVIQDCGCWFDRLNPEADLRNILQQLIAQPARVAECGRQAVRRITAYFQWYRIAIYYEEVFQRLVAGNPLRTYDEFLSAYNPPMA
jgi:glycosyltransferase involved in cell wall biosynthesis